MCHVRSTADLDGVVADAGVREEAAEEVGRHREHGTCKTVKARFGNIAHTRQSRPDYGLGVQVKALEMYQIVPSSHLDGVVADAGVRAEAAEEVRK